jgi:hypothetical protein
MNYKEWTEEKAHEARMRSIWIHAIALGLVMSYFLSRAIN